MRGAELVQVREPTVGEKPPEEAKGKGLGWVGTPLTVHVIAGPLGSNGIAP